MSALQQMMVARNTIFATFNPADKSSEITLSGGNLVASLNTPASNCLVRSTVSKTIGKWYWELTCTSINNYSYLGIANASEATSAYVGATANGLGYTNDGYLIKSSVISSSVPNSYVTSDVLGFALDASGGTLELFLNNVSQGSYSVNPAGAVFAAIGATAGSGAISITANFGASAFVYSPPSGFNSGLFQ